MRTLLKDFDSNRVDVYIGYANQLKKENPLFKNTTPEEFANVFKKVAADSLLIDGDSVSLTYDKKIIIIYDYHAYKNKIQIRYPETIFDFELVYSNDPLPVFSKDSGKINYTHEIGNPFDLERKIIGAYGIIKNSRGEFLETINVNDIEKMKNSSSVKDIWEIWFDRMVLKSIIKRICNIHFHDITKNMDAIDNETNNPENATIKSDLQTKINEAKTEKELVALYKEYLPTVEDKVKFIELVGAKRKELAK